jgi:hypothetical protein
VRDFIVVIKRLRTIFARRNNGLPILNPASAPVTCVKTLAWTVKYDPRVEKDRKVIDRAMQREILDYMEALMGRRPDYLRHSVTNPRSVRSDHQAHRSTAYD